MQRMWKQSPKQSVGLHDIRLHTKKAPLPKITWTYRGGGRPLRLPLDPPLISVLPANPHVHPQSERAIGLPAFAFPAFTDPEAWKAE